MFWTVIDPVQPLSANGVCGTVRQICRKAGGEKFGPHRLRHTFTTGMLASGATLQEILGLLRHDHRRATAIYTKVDKNRLTQLVPEWPAAPHDGAEEALDLWVGWVRRCRIPAFVDLQRRIVRHRASILAAIKHGLSNGRIESVNAKIRLITRVAFGFHSPEPLIPLAMLNLGGHKPVLPGRK